MWHEAIESAPLLLRKNWPDEARFWSVLPPRIKQAAASFNGETPCALRCGENARPRCGVKAKPRLLAIRLEQLWDELVRACGVDTLCAYPSNGSLRDESGSVSNERNPW